jgi:hypothetical protein
METSELFNIFIKIFCINTPIINKSRKQYMHFRISSKEINILIFIYCIGRVSHSQKFIGEFIEMSNC